MACLQAPPTIVAKIACSRGSVHFACFPSEDSTIDAIAALTSRSTAGALTDPAPDRAALQQILAAATRAPDHGRLRPWRFVVVLGAARAQLGAVLAEALQRRMPDATPAQLERERGKPLRAPMIIGVCAIVHPEARIPVIEQVLSAGAAAQNIMVAAHALGYGSAWKTGEAAYDPTVKAALGLQSKDAIVGFIYLGMHAQPLPAPQALDPWRFVVEWSQDVTNSAVGSSGAK